MTNIVSVKHDPRLGLAPIFRPLGPKERKEGKLDITIEPKQSLETIRVVCHEPLGADDQSVLFAVLALCTNQDKGITLSVTTKSSVGRLLRQALIKKGTTDRDSVRVEITEREMLKVMGKRDSGSNYTLLRENLDRLASVTLLVDSPAERYQMQLLASHVNKKTGMLNVAVNVHSAGAILGDEYTYISLKEHNSIRSEITQILHGWLCSWLPQGKRRKIMIESLVKHVYPNYSKVSPASQRVYRSKTKRAAIGLNDLPGWKVVAEGRMDDLSFTIRRPKGSNLD